MNAEETTAPEAATPEPIDALPQRLSPEQLADGLGFLSDVPLQISVEIGRRRMSIGELLSLGPSSVIELTKAAGEPLDVRVNDILVARGEPVVVNDRFGVRLTSLVETNRLLNSLAGE